MFTTYTCSPTIWQTEKMKYQKKLSCCIYDINISVPPANTQMNLSFNNYVCKPIWLSPIHKYYATYIIGYLNIIVVIGHGEICLACTQSFILYTISANLFHEQIVGNKPRWRLIVLCHWVWCSILAITLHLNFITYFSNIRTAECHMEYILMYKSLCSYTCIPLASWLRARDASKQWKYVAKWVGHWYQHQMLVAFSQATII